MSYFYFYCNNSPRVLVREIRALEETLEEPFGCFLLPTLENKKRRKGHQVRLTRSHFPRPAVPDPVSVLAYRHSAAHGHLLLPSRPEPSTKPPLEFVLIPRSRGWPRSPNAPRLLILRAGGDSAEPPSPRRPLFSQSVKNRPHTASPRLAQLGRALAQLTHRRRGRVEMPTEGKPVHPGSNVWRRQVAP